MRGIMYYMNNTFSIKGIFQLFPCLYFKSKVKRMQMIGNLFQPNLNYSIIPKFSISMNRVLKSLFHSIKFLPP